MTKSPVHTFESSVSNLLLEMYEQSGHQLALQYGGSGLAHTVSTFNKTNVFDTLTSLKRYYNNVFSDNEKQMSINLFLGIFRPHLYQLNNPNSNYNSIWTMETDYFLHMDRISHDLLCNYVWWKFKLDDKFTKEYFLRLSKKNQKKNNKTKNKHTKSMNSNNHNNKLLKRIGYLNLLPILMSSMKCMISQHSILFLNQSF